MNTLDYIILAILAFNAILGAMRGGIWQILRIVSIIAGIWVARQYGETVAQKLPENLRGEGNHSVIIAQVAIFLTVYIVGFAVTNMVKTLVAKIQLGSLDRLLGAAVGAAKGAALICVVLYLQYLPLVNQVPIVGDQLYGSKDGTVKPSACNDQFLTRVKPWLDQHVPEGLAKRVDDLKQKISTTGK